MQIKSSVFIKIKKIIFSGRVATLGIGFACSLIAFAIVWDLEQQKIAEEFEQDGIEIITAIEQNIAKSLQNLNSIVSLYSVSERVNRQEFRQFTKNNLANNPLLKTLEWVPRITEEAREAYEQAARKDGLTDFAIREQDSNQQTVRAKSRKEYFPVYFVEPSQGNEKKLGFDLASNPSYLKALQLARDTGRAIATEPITLVEKKELPQKGVAVFHPIYHNQTSNNTVTDRRQNLKGFALAVFTIEDIIRKVLPEHQSQEINLLILNQSASPESRLVYASDASLSSKIVDAYTCQHELYVPGQEWLIVLQPSYAYIWQRITWHPWGVLAGGILLTIVLYCHIQERISIEARLKEKELQLELRVQQRTENLIQAEDSLLQSNSLLQGISLAQSRFINNDVEPKLLFNGLLDNLLAITNSEYGFIGEIFYTEAGKPYAQEAYMKIQGQPYLKTHAITNIAWNKETEEFYAENAPQGMKFDNLQTLFGVVMVTGKPVIANNPSTDKRLGALPPGHPPLNAFLGLPFYNGNRLLGMVGIANRSNGYNQALIDYLEPFLATCSNIIQASRSEKKRQDSESALRASEERYRQIVETSNEGIWLLDAQGKTSFVNPQVLQMLGYTEEEIFNQSLFDFLDPSDQEIKEVVIQRIASLPPGMSESYDLKFCCHDGSKLWAIVSLSSIVDHTSEPIGTLAMIRDISDRKQAEIELATAKSRAEVANRTKSHFLSNMSHELRTPLNGILGSVRLMQSSLNKVSEPQNYINSNFIQAVKTIEGSGSHLLNLIDDILDYAQIDTCTVELCPIPINLGSFIAEISALVRSQAIAKNLTFTSEISLNLPQGIEVDRQRLKQILLELFNNAVKFTHQGEITLRIIIIDSGEFLPTSGDSKFQARNFTTLRFEVIDTGIGIKPEQITAIFLPFEQGGELHNKAAGTGLGLTIAQQLLRSMNSDLKVTSPSGIGSTFWFDITLPVVPVSGREKLTEIDAIVNYQGKKRRLLIVDDKAEYRWSLHNLLESMGFEVFLAENGQQGVEMAQKLQPDLILIDLVMPIKTGFEAVAELRKIPYFYQIPIIAISSSVLETNQEPSKIPGCDAFLAKPIEKQKLLHLLEKYLKLSWNYQEKSQPISMDCQDRVLKTEDLITPPVEDLETLYELAMLGSMKKIRQWAIALAEEDVKYQPFANLLQELSQDFQEKAIVSLVEQYLSSNIYQGINYDF